MPSRTKKKQMKRFPMVEHIEQKLLHTGLADGAHALRLLLDRKPTEVIQHIPECREKMRVALFYQRIKKCFPCCCNSHTVPRW